MNSHLTAWDQKRLQKLEAAIDAGEVEPRSALAHEFRREHKKDCMKTSEGDMLSHYNAEANCVCSLVPDTRKKTSGVLCSHGLKVFRRHALNT